MVILIVVITVISTILAHFSISIYKNSAADKSQQAVYDTSVYFMNELRRCESFEHIRTGAVGGKIPALVISSDAAENEKEKETWLFQYDGHLMKSTVTAGETVSPEAASTVMPLNAANFRILQPGLLEITIVTETGENDTFNLHLADNGGNTNE